MIIYLHGFGGDSKSLKAPILRAELDVDVYTPSYPSNDIDAAMQIVSDLIEKHQDKHETIMLMGTSMGGFIAQYLGRKYGTKVVMINPALQASKTLKRYIGQNAKFNSGERFTLTAENVKAFKKYEMSEPRHNFGSLLLLDEGDKVIDYRHAYNMYKGHATRILYKGGSHRFDHFEESLPAIKEYYDKIWY